MDQQYQDLKHGPALLLEIAELMEHEALKSGQLTGEQAKRLAFNQVKRLAMTYGSNTLYMPGLKKLDNAIRDRNIYKEFNGKNIYHLTQKYKLCDRKIRQIIAEQRQLHIEIAQAKLF